MERKGISTNPTSVNSLSSAASASPSPPSAATTGLISFLRPFTRFFGFAVAGASFSITTVERQSRNISKLASSSEGIISSGGFLKAIAYAHNGKQRLVFNSLITDEMSQNSKISFAWRSIEI